MNGDKVTAIYNPSEIEEYKGNPFIESLPKIMEQREIVGYLRSSHKVKEEEIARSKEIRVHSITRLADSFFQPLSCHIELCRKVSLMIRGGYVGRNTRNGDYKKQLQNGYERIQTGNLAAYKFNDVRSTAQSMVLIGCSGSGKTTSLNRILFSYPQVIYHPELNIEQVVYLRIDCSHNGSLKEICLNFFRALDKAIGSEYEAKYGLKRHGVEQLLGVMSQLANSHALGILVIDEIQHLIKSKAGATDAMMNFFVTLVNTISIPVIMVGTPKAQSIFDADLRSARRAAGYGAIYWAPLDPNGREEDRSEWEGFTNKLWEAQYLQKRDLVLTKELRDVWYDLSQGVTDIVVKLFLLAQLRAIVIGHERITAGLLKKVYEDELKPVHPMLNALRSKDPVRIAEYSDLMIPGMERRMYQITQQILAKSDKTEEELALESLTDDDQKNIFTRLCGEVDSGQLVQAIREVSANNTTGNRSSNMFEVIKILEDKKNVEVAKPQKVKIQAVKESEWIGLETDDLRYMYSQSATPEQFHKQLKLQGMVLDLREYLCGAG